MLSPIMLVLLGLVLAFAGARFIWLLIGIAGFILGYDLVMWFFPDPTGVIPVIIGIVVGAIGAFFAKKFAKILIMAAAFILIGNAVLVLFGNLFNVTGTLTQILVFVVGGLIGLALVRFAFKWAIITICALGGGALVAQGLPAMFNTTQGTLAVIIGAVVAIAGFVVQARSPSPAAESA